MSRNPDLRAAMYRFKQHFKQPVAGRSLYEFGAQELVEWIEASIKEEKIDPRLTGDDYDLVEFAQPEWVEIVSDDADSAASSLLFWSGFSEVWRRCEDRWTRRDIDWEYGFLDEVAEACNHIFIHREEWDGGAPGRSGIWVTVSSDDQFALHAELRHQMALLLVRARETLRRKLRRRLSTPERAHTPEHSFTLPPAGSRFFDVGGVPIAEFGENGGVFSFDTDPPHVFSRYSIEQNGTAIDESDFYGLLMGARTNGLSDDDIVRIMDKIAAIGAPTPGPITSKLLEAWAAENRSLHGGSFRGHKVSFGYSGSTDIPFLSTVIGYGNRAEQVLQHLLDHSEDQGARVLDKFQAHAAASTTRIDQLPLESIPTQSKRMIKAMLEYSIYLSETALTMRERLR